VHIHAGYNQTWRRDWGRHDDERGGGPGIGLAFHHFVGDDESPFFIGARVDGWLLRIRYREDDIPTNAVLLDGDRSDAVVLVPTVRAGWLAISGRVNLDFTVSFGRELNVATRGEEVGEGAILLLGAGFSW
jgi:hypothetical protein